MAEDNNLKNDESVNSNQNSESQQNHNQAKAVKGNGVVGVGCLLIFILIFA